MESLRNFFAEKRRKIILGTVVTGASYYAYKKLKNISATAQSQYNARDTRLKTYFEDSQQTLSSIVLSTIPNMYEQIANIIEVPPPTQLRNCKSKEEKILMWEKLEYQTFARLVVATYSVVLLSVMLRIQINLVGRYIYRDQVEQGSSLPLQDQTNTAGEPMFDESTQEKYLAHSEYLVKQGLEKLATVVQNVTRKVLVDWPLTRNVSFDDMLILLLSIRGELEATPALLLDSLLPPESSLDLEDVRTISLLMLLISLQDAILGMLIGETRNIIESRSLHVVFKQTLDYAFLQVIHNLRSSFKLDTSDANSTESTANEIQQSDSNNPPTDASNQHSSTESEATESSSEANAIQEQETAIIVEGALVTLPMAKVIPIVRKQFNFVLQSQTNDIVDALAHFQKLQNYSYELFTKK